MADQNKIDEANDMVKRFFARAVPTDRPVIDFDIHEFAARIRGTSRMDAKRTNFMSLYGLGGLTKLTNDLIVQAGTRFGRYMERLPWVMWRPPIKEKLKGRGYKFEGSQSIQVPFGAFSDEVFRRMTLMPGECLIAQRLGQYVIDHHADPSVDEFFIGVQARIAWRCAMRVVRPLQETKP